MITIVNVSTHNSPFGWHEYELRINAKVIAKFRHKREEGLTKCLERAAEAAKKAKWMEAQEMFDALSSNTALTGDGLWARLRVDRNAEGAGMTKATDLAVKCGIVYYHTPKGTTEMHGTDRQIEMFAEAIRMDERERLAKLFDQQDVTFYGSAIAASLRRSNDQHEGRGADRRSVPLDAPVGREED